MPKSSKFEILDLDPFIVWSLVLYHFVTDLLKNLVSKLEHTLSI